MSFLVKGAAQCLLVPLCLLGLLGVGQVGAVDTIQDNCAISQEVGLTPQGGSIRQFVVGWGLDTVGLNCTSSIMNSFQNVKGTIAASQATGNLNNVATLVMVNQGAAAGTGNSLLQPSYFTNSVIANNVLRNYSSAYNCIIGGGSFQNSHAVLGVTQVAGNMNNISNVVGFSTKGASSLALSNATLSNVTASNNVYQNLGVTQANVQIQSDSFKGFSGVGSVIQAAGNMIQINSNVSVRVNQ